MEISSKPSSAAEKAAVTEKAEPTEKAAVSTKVPRNPNMAKLKAGFLFQEVGRRLDAHIQKYP
eukprot:c8192_g1_i1 orf=114-302(+)